MIGDIRTALAAVLAGVPGLRAYDHLPGQVEPPAALVRPETIDYEITTDGAIDLTLVVVVLVAGVHERTSQAALDAYLDHHGESSIVAAVAADPTLGDVVDAARVTGLRSWGQMDYAGVAYLAAELTVAVMA